MDSVGGVVWKGWVVFNTTDEAELDVAKMDVVIELAESRVEVEAESRVASGAEKISSEDVQHGFGGAP